MRKGGSREGSQEEGKERRREGGFTRERRGFYYTKFDRATSP